MLINALLRIKTSSHSKLTWGLATKASLLHTLQIVYTFLPKTQAILAMNRTWGLSLRKQLLRKEQKRNSNMLQKLWPIKKCKNAECIPGCRPHVCFTTLYHAPSKIIRSLWGFCD